MWNFLVSRKGTISNAWFFPPWRPECLTSQQIKSVEIRKTVFLQYDECLALQQIKSIKARKTPCEEIFVFSLTEVLVPSIETLMFNFSWLRFSEKAQMKRWQILASVPSRQMIAYIYTTENLTAKRFYINLISLILFKLDCSQNTGILFRRSAEDLKSFNIWQVLMGVSASPNHQTHLRVRYGKSLIFFFLVLLSKTRDWSTCEKTSHKNVLTEDMNGKSDKPERIYISL